MGPEGDAGWRVEIVEGAAEFAARSRSWLARHPVKANLLATYLEGVLAGDRPADVTQWILVLDAGGAVAAAAMHASPWNVFLGPMPGTAAQAVARALAGRQWAVPGVMGTCPDPADFAAAWRQVTGQAYRRTMAQRMYALAEPPPAPDVPGSPRPASAAEADLCVAWLQAFAREADPHGPRLDPVADVTRRLALGQLTVWEDDGEPVSLAGSQAPAAGVVRIGPVYTPPGRRRRGYAGALTAAVSRAALADGARLCMLYTDLANPTSNAVYQRIGYLAVADVEQYASDRGGT